MSEDVFATELKALRAPFPPGTVKQRKASRSGPMLDYVSIDATINRLLDVLGTDWSFSISTVEVTPIILLDREGDEQQNYLAVVSGTLTAVGSAHGGVGADIATDADKAVKTALAEALKKAGHQLGIGLYLWDAEERARLADQRRAAAGDKNALKKIVSDMATDNGFPATAAGIAEYHGVSVKDLSDIDMLRELAGV